MPKAKLILIPLGSAHSLTKAEIQGPFAELGVMRSKTPF